MKKLTFLVLLSFSLQALEVYLPWGGGCGNNQTLQKFTESFRKRLTLGSWKILDGVYVDSVQGSILGTKSNLEALLNKSIIEFDLANCQKANGANSCKILLHFAAHGYPGDLFSPELLLQENREQVNTDQVLARSSLNHSLCDKNQQKMELQSLLPFLEKLRSLNVSIGIIDESCYSGHTVKQFAGVACVLSSSSAHLPHYSSSSATSYNYSLNQLSQIPSYVQPNSLPLQELYKFDVLNVANASGLVNFPLMSSILENNNLIMLNEMTRFLEIYAMAQAYSSILSYAVSLTPEAFTLALSKCQDLYSLAVNLPMEVILGSESYKNFHLNYPQEEKLCRQISTIRNHYEYLLKNSSQGKTKIRDNFIGLLNQLLSLRPLQLDTLVPELLKQPLSSLANLKSKFRLVDPTERLPFQNAASHSELFYQCSSLWKKMKINNYQKAKVLPASICLNIFKSINIEANATSCANFQI
jgi:hypothetical protein